MPQITPLLIVAAIIFCIFAAFKGGQMWTQKKEGKITASGWAFAMEILRRTADKGIALYKSQQLGKEALIDQVVNLVWTEIQFSNLSDADKAFFTEAKIRMVAEPVMTRLINSIGLYTASSIPSTTYQVPGMLENDKPPNA